MQAIIDFLWSLPPGILHTFGYLFFFGGSFTEGLPVFGMFVPGQTIGIIGGFFSRIEIFNPFLMTIVLTLGAVLGDIFSYYIGKKYGYGFIEKYGKYVRIKKDDLQKLITMTHKHFGKAIFIGRFNSFARSFVAFISGVSGIKKPKFFFYVFVSSLFWATGCVVAGYLLGKSYDTMSKILGPLMTIGIGVVLFMVFGYRYINKRKHIFDKKYLITLIVSAISIFIFAKTSQDIVHIKSLAILDTFVNMKVDMLSFLPFFSSDFVLGIMTFFDTYFGFPFMIFLALCLLIFLWIKKKKYHFRILLLSMFGAVSVEIILESIMRNIHHGIFLNFITSFSFPASHVTMATIFFFGFWTILRQRIKYTWQKVVFLFLCCIGILLIAFSKMFVGGESLIRVLSGLSLGISIITFIMLVLRVLLSRKPK